MFLQIGNLQRLLTFCSEREPQVACTVRRMAMASLTTVFKDLSPWYVQCRACILVSYMNQCSACKYIIYTHTSICLISSLQCCSMYIVITFENYQKRRKLPRYVCIHVDPYGSLYVYHFQRCLKMFANCVCLKRHFSLFTSDTSLC